MSIGHRDDHGNYRRRVGVAALSVVAMLPAISPAAAQTAETKQTPPEANGFFQRMHSALQNPAQPDTARGITRDEAGVLAGYFQLRAERVLANNTLPVAVDKRTCQRVLDAKAPGIYNLLFKQSYDLGMKVMLGLDLQESLSMPEPKESDNRVELSLFRLRQQGGNRCTPELNYFAQAPLYESAWRPLNSLSRKELNARLLFDPWATRSSDGGMINYAWAGALGAASLVGPIGIIATTLFGGKTSPASNQVENRSLAQSALNFGDFGDLLPPLFKPLNVTAPSATRASFAPPVLTFRWDMKHDGRTLYSVGYRFTVEYRASVLLPGERTFRTLTDSDLDTMVFNAGNDMSGDAKTALANLLKQDSATFNAACDPVLSAMESAGFSVEDRAAVVYGAAIKVMSATQTSSVACLSNPTMRAALVRWGRELPNPYAASTPAQVGEVTGRVIGYVRAPAPTKAQFEAHLDDEIWIGGERRLLGDPNAPAGKAAAVRVTRAQFTRNMGLTEPWLIGPSKCGQSSTAAATTLAFPALSGHRDPTDAVMAFPIRRTASSGFHLLFVGLSGARTATGSLINQVWLGTPTAAQGQASVALFERLTNPADPACRSALNLPALPAAEQGPGAP